MPEVGTADLATLKVALDALSARHRALAANVANAQTPGYRRKDVSFEEVLRSVTGEGELGLRRTRPEHLPSGGRAGFTAAVRQASAPGVDIDMEMAELARNTLLYQTYAEIVSRKLGMLRLAIRGE